MAKKNTSPSDNGPDRSRSHAPRKSASRAAPQREHAEPIATAADMSAASTNATYTPSYDEIAEAAYRRYLTRGGQDGADFDDWVEAERELRGRYSR